MNLTFDPTWLAAVFLTSVRTGTLLLISPVFTALRGFVLLRVLFAVALGVLLGSQATDAALDVRSAFVMAQALAGEVLVGMALAFGVMAAFAVFSVAGSILDIQIGLGMGAVYDPVTRDSGPMLGTLLNLLGVAVFFALDGHHMLMRGLAYSVAHVPPGQGWTIDATRAAVAQFGLMFSLGLALVAPVMLSLLLMEAGLAVLARMLPQINVFVISVPAKSIAGLILLALCMPALGGPLGRVYASIFHYWESVLT